MKTLYKNSRLIAAAIVGTLTFSAGTAVAIAKDNATTPVRSSAANTQVDELGRFVVTSRGATYVRPAQGLGRFVVSQNGTIFLPSV